MKRPLVACILATTLVGSTTARAQSFPPDDSPAWLPLTISGAEVRDANADVVSTGGRNVIGASPVDQPSVLVASDATYLYFRLRLDAQPTSTTLTWACELDVDQDLSNSYEYFVGFFGAAATTAQTQAWYNSVRSTPPGDEAESLTGFHGTAFHLAKLSTIGPGTNWWQSWAIPRSDLGQPGFEVTPLTVLRCLCGTTSDGRTHLPGGAGSDIAGSGDFSDGIVCDENGCRNAGTVDVTVARGSRWSLANPWPNPARSNVRIEFTLGRTELADLSVFDLSGRRVSRLASQLLSQGPHTARWDIRDAAGQAVPPGIYLLRLQSGSHRLERRVAVLH